jgi:hypothetical protein
MSEPERMIVFSWALALVVIAYILVKKKIEK